MRVIRNRLARKFEELEKNNADTSELDALGRGALRKAVVEGDIDNGSVMSGQIAGLVNREQSAGEIIKEMSSQYKAILQGMDF